jgi:hypothetical protein
MIRKIIIIFAIVSVMVMTVHYYLFSFNRISILTVSDSLFYVGFPLFLLGLGVISNANDLFVGIGYFFKNVINGKKPGSTYFDYIQTKKKRGLSQVWLIVFIISIFLVTASLILANNYLQNL